MNWHFVTDELPPDEGWYLVYAPTWIGQNHKGNKNINGVMISRFNKKGEWGAELHENNKGCVEQWTKIPIPPVRDIDIISEDPTMETGYEAHPNIELIKRHKEKEKKKREKEKEEERKRKESERKSREKIIKKIVR